MRTLAGCVLLLGLTGCHFGSHGTTWKHASRDVDRYADRTESQISSVPLPGEITTPSPDASHLPPPPPPAPPPEPEDIDANPQADAGALGWFSARNSAGKPDSKTASQKKPNRATKLATSQEEAVKQLLARVDRAKRDKANQESKLGDESFRQSQRRLELEAQIAVLQEQLRQQQEQLRQQSALQQVAHQQQTATVPPTTATGGLPIITTGRPSPSPTGPQAFGPTTGPPTTVAPTTVGSGVPAWNTPAPTWNPPALPDQSSVEMWPFSPQRR